MAKVFAATKDAASLQGDGNKREREREKEGQGEARQ
jgi:hypothetical protein